MGDGTDVDVDELKKFGDDAHGRGDNTESVAKAVEGVHVGPDVLGVFNAALISDLLADQNEIVTKARAIAAALAQDGDIAHANAEDFTSTETAHADRFRNTELR